MLKSIKYDGRAKNVIIFVGDGMGIQTHTMARIYKVTGFLKIFPKILNDWYFYYHYDALRVSWEARLGRRVSWPGRPSLTLASLRLTTRTNRQETPYYYYYLTTIHRLLQVPDSAGTATALFTGVKTGMGLVGMDHLARRGVCERRKGSELTSMADWAAGQGRKVGVVTTARITHATPASLYAHSNDRSALSIYLVWTVHFIQPILVFWN